MSIDVQATEDGSETCFNDEFGQAYHSKFGAYREALEKHVRACKIPELAENQGMLKILDICFGLGYNSFVAIDEACKVNPEIEIEIIGLENDTEILKKIPECKMPKSISVIASEAKQSIPEHGLVHYIRHDKYSIDLLMGDARETVKTLEEASFDAVFFDPFSPSVCPQLWTEEFIAEVVSKVKVGAYISTYSTARVVKDNFKNAGCEITEGPLCGRRNGGVLARRQCFVPRNDS